MPLFSLFRTLSVLLSLALAVAWDLRVGHSELRVGESWIESVEAGSNSPHGELQKQARRPRLEAIAGFGTTIRAGSGQADEPHDENETEDEAAAEQPRLLHLYVPSLHAGQAQVALLTPPSPSGPRLLGRTGAHGRVMRARSHLEAGGEAQA